MQPSIFALVIKALMNGVAKTLIEGMIEIILLILPFVHARFTDSGFWRVLTEFICVLCAIVLFHLFRAIYVVWKDISREPQPVAMEHALYLPDQSRYQRAVQRPAYFQLRLVIIGIFGLVVLGAFSYGAYFVESVHVAHNQSEQRQTTPPPLTGFMQFGGLYFEQGYNVLAIGKPIRVATFHRNEGSEPVQNALAAAVFLLQECVKPGEIHHLHNGNTRTITNSCSDEDRDKDAWNAFHEIIEPRKQDYINGKWIGSQIGTKMGCWGHAEWTPSNHWEISELRNGELKMYIFAWSAWKDYQDRPGSEVVCRRLIPPSSRTLARNAVSWNICNPDS
jgi:hypothetical protein